MRNEKNTAIVLRRLAVLRRNLIMFGVPLCIGLGIALTARLDLLINHTAIATAMSFYLVSSIGLLWASDARHQMTMHTLAQLESENDRLRDKTVTSDTQANYDGLTKLPNIRLLSDRFLQATERAKRSKTHVALYLVTLDDFSPIKERYGAQAATKVVTTTAARLKHVLRDSDTLVRVSGSDFVVIAESIKDIAHTQCLIDKMRQVLRKPIEVDDTTIIRPYEKLACATFPNDGPDLDSLLVKARTALEFISPHVVTAKASGTATQAASAVPRAGALSYQS